MDLEPSGLTFLVIGLFQGAVYGLLAVGLVLVYKGARIFNFAQGEFGTVAAFVTFALFQQAGLPYGVA
ncbi:MAG: ABC transporter permease subunit, partial [Actinomycetota bacterium]